MTILVVLHQIGSNFSGVVARHVHHVLRIFDVIVHVVVARHNGSTPAAINRSCTANMAPRRSRSCSSHRSDIAILLFDSSREVTTSDCRAEIAGARC